MPINIPLKKSLTKKYGPKRAEKIYFGMENSKGKAGDAYKKGLKTATKQGLTQAHYKTKKTKIKKGTK